MADERDRLGMILEGVDRLSPMLATAGKNIKALTAFALNPMTLAVAAGAAALVGWVRAGTAVTKIAIEQAKAFAADGDEIAKNASRLGVMSEELSRLYFIADRFGVNQASMATGFRTVSRTAYDATQGLQEAKDAYSALGIKVTDAEGRLRPVNELFYEIIERLRSMTDKTAQLALAQRVLGRGGLELATIFARTREEFDATTADADRYGAILSTKATQAAEAFQDAQTNLNVALRGGRAVLAESILPALSDSYNTLAKFIADNRENLRVIGDTVANGLTEGTAQLATFLTEHGDELKSILELAAKASGSVIKFVFEGSEVVARAVMAYQEGKKIAPGTGLPTQILAGYGKMAADDLGDLFNPAAVQNAVRGVQQGAVEAQRLADAATVTAVQAKEASRAYEKVVLSLREARYVFPRSVYGSALRDDGSMPTMPVPQLQRAPGSIGDESELQKWYEIGEVFKQTYGEEIPEAIRTMAEAQQESFAKLIVAARDYSASLGETFIRDMGAATTYMLEQVSRSHLAMMRYGASFKKSAAAAWDQFVDYVILRLEAMVAKLILVQILQAAIGMGHPGLAKGIGTFFGITPPSGSGANSGDTSPDGAARQGAARASSILPGDVRIPAGAMGRKFELTVNATTFGGREAGYALSREIHSYMVEQGLVTT